MFWAVLDPVVVERIATVIAVADRLVMVRRPTTTVVLHAQGTGLLTGRIRFLYVPENTRQSLKLINYKSRTVPNGQLNDNFSRTICVHQKLCYKKICVEMMIAT